jgi:hypothetical protein
MGQPLIIALSTRREHSPAFPGASLHCLVSIVWQFASRYDAEMLRIGCLAMAALLSACSDGSYSIAAEAGRSTEGLTDAAAGGDALAAGEGSAAGGADAPSLVKVPEIDAPAELAPCEVAAAQGATYCELGAGGLEYCEPQPEGGVCVELSDPPRWVYDLLVGCYAECVVLIRTSERVLSGSCCYIAWGIDVGP